MSSELFTLIIPIRGIELPDDLGSGVYIVDGEILFTGNRTCFHEVVDTAWNRWDSSTKQEVMNLIEETQVVVYAKYDGIQSASSRSDFLHEKRQLIQPFIFGLWLVKDNAVSGEVSYLVRSHDGMYDSIESRSWYTNSIAGGYNSFTRFSREEILKALEYSKLWKDNPPVTIGEEPKDRTNNMTLAISFADLARRNYDIRLKVILNCSALEAFLMKNTQGGIAHKLSERVALLIGSNPQERKEVYEKMKTIYNVRSKLAHGNQKKIEKVREAAQNSDEYLRRAFQKVFESPLPDQPEEFFLKKLFGL